MALSKAKTKLLERLRHSRFRSREGLFLVEGIRGVEEAMDATLPHAFRFALTSPRLRDTLRGREVAARLEKAGVSVADLPDDELARVADTEQPQGLLLVAEEPALTLEDVLAGLPGHRPPRLLLLDGLQDPGNAGTLIRAARAFGVDGVVALEGTVDPWNPKVVRASAGALFHLPVVREGREGVLPLLGEARIPLLAADASGTDVRRLNAPQAWALVVGNEGAGVEEELLEVARDTVAVPMAPGVESLNAGVAGSILLFALTASPRARRGEEPSGAPAEDAPDHDPRKGPPDGGTRKEPPEHDTPTGDAPDRDTPAKEGPAGDVCPPPAEEGEGA
jgi:TrmH family RNA methyltransferase